MWSLRLILVAVLSSSLATGSASWSEHTSAAYPHPEPSYPPKHESIYADPSYGQPEYTHSLKPETPYSSHTHTSTYTQSLLDHWHHSSTYVKPPHNHYTSHVKPPPHPTSKHVPPPSPPPPPPPPPSLLSLSEALIAAGCSKFLELIKSDADVWALYNSEQVQSVFAPGDASLDNSTSASRARLMVMIRAHALHRRADLTPEQQQELDLAADTEQTNMAKLRRIPGALVKTNDKSANLKGANQVLVSDSRNSTTGGVKISSGLGSIVNVLLADFAYTKGFIHVTDGFFTNPQLLSVTASKIPSTSKFASLLSESASSAKSRRQDSTNDTIVDSIKTAIDATPLVTVFIPSDSAFLEAGQVLSGEELLSGHVVVAKSEGEQVGYLPNLANGQSLTTADGGQLEVTVQGEEYFVNGGKIEMANLVLPNGVAHVVNKVLTASPPVVTSGSMGPVGGGISRPALAGVVGAAVLWPLLTLF